MEMSEHCMVAEMLLHLEKFDHVIKQIDVQLSNNNNKSFYQASKEFISLLLYKPLVVLPPEVHLPKDK